MKDLVRHIQNYFHLTDSEVKRLKEEARVISLKKKDFLLREGEICQSNYFVSQGCLRMCFIKKMAQSKLLSLQLKTGGFLII